MIRFFPRCSLARLRKDFAAVCADCQDAEFAQALVCGRCSKLIPVRLAAEKSAFELLGM